MNRMIDWFARNSVAANLLAVCLIVGGRSHVVIATFEPLRGKETVEVWGWQKRVLAVCG